VSFDQATVGPYLLLRTLQAPQVGGAFLAVRSGEEGFEKPVVLHCAPRSRLEQIVAEATRAARLSHAGIAHVLDVGVHESLAYIALEHVEGMTLHTLLLRRGPLPWRSAARVAAEVARALAYAHGRRDDEGRLLGIVHRRISPRRIVLDSEANPRLTGFGVSWAWPNPAGFGSPEEQRGEPVDGRADVFALGRVLRQCLDLDRAPQALSELVQWAMHPLPEHRPTSSTLHASLGRTLRGAKPSSDRAELRMRVR